MGENDYGLGQTSSRALTTAPDLPYQPPTPRHYRPAIGLIGCGGISQQHLKAYQRAGFNVVMLCDRHQERARARQAEFFPQAELCTDYRDLLRRPDIEIVDITTHPQGRAQMMEAALRARKHVLSQKPFVIDLDEGERLVALAEQMGVNLAVNQNGRWAPHFSYLRQALTAGCIGRLMSAHMAVHWNHNWVLGTPFEAVRHLVLYDFGIHWFDMITQFFAPKTATRVFASVARSPAQKVRPPLLAQALIEFPEGQASLVLDADTPFGELDTTYLAGTAGTLRSEGPSLTEQTVTLITAAGRSQPALTGSWFPDGFHGAMAELICAIEDKRHPINNARDTLSSLALCFAAVSSADQGHPIVPGTVRRLPQGVSPTI